MSSINPTEKLPAPAATPGAPMRRQVAITLVILATLGAVWFGVLAYSHSHAQAEPAADTPAGLGNAVRVSDAGRKITRMETETVQLDRPSGVIHTTGTVSFPVDHKEVVSPRLTGRIRTVLVKVGDHVAVGQTLATMDSLDAANAQTAARQADNRLRLARLAYERQKRLYGLGTPDVTAAQAALDQAKQHAAYTQEALRRVREQAQIGGFTEKPLADAQADQVGAAADLAQAQSDLAIAQKEQERTSHLVDIGVAAKRDLEAANNAAEKAEVAVSADRERLKIAEQTLEREKRAFKTNLYADQQVRSAESDNEQAQLQAQAADRALRLARAQILRDLKQAESDLQAAQTDDDNAHNALTLLGNPSADGAVAIKSPIAGVVTDRQVNPGQIVDQSQETPWQMFTVVDSRSVWVDADLYEKDQASAGVGQTAHITASALPGYSEAGRIIYVAAALDPHTHTLKVRCEIPNPGGLLKEGQYVDVTLEPKPGARLVAARPAIPLSAVRQDGEDNLVYVEQSDGSFTPRKIKLGDPVGEDRVMVASGLRPGERIVTHGALFLGQSAGGD